MAGREKGKNLEEGGGGEMRSDWRRFDLRNSILRKEDGGTWAGRNVGAVRRKSRGWRRKADLLRRRSKVGEWRRFGSRGAARKIEDLFQGRDGGGDGPGQEGGIGEDGLDAGKGAVGGMKAEGAPCGRNVAFPRGK